MKKTVRLGKTKIGNRLVSVFCQIEITEGKLSITGVEGPMSNGDAVGSCGQIDMSRPEIVELAPGWNQSRLAQFWDIWGKWHLNDMRPGCQHQQTWDIKKKLTLQSLTWGDKYHELRRQAENGIMPADRFADWGRVVKQVESLTSYNSAKHPDKWNELGKRLLADGLVKLDKTETKNAGWVTPEEHPEGLLCKPCPVCGYEYGSQWLREELPADVVKFLESLPETDIQPAWV